MGKHPIGGMRSMIVPNRKADMRFRKKMFLRNKEQLEETNRKKEYREKLTYNDKGGNVHAG